MDLGKIAGFEERQLQGLVVRGILPNDSGLVDIYSIMDQDIDIKIAKQFALALSAFVANAIGITYFVSKDIDRKFL